MAASVHLYLIRHGIAADLEDCASDEERPLKAEGANKTRKVAKRLCELGLHFDLILTSPLVRSRQTAQILQEAGLGSQIEVSAVLAPGGDIKLWLTWLQTWQQTGGTSLAIVGHEPDLSNWAQKLMWGEARQVLTLKKAGVMGLSLPETGSPLGRSQLFWLTPPKFLLS